jgi:acyl-CoA reductase-like NAD-dependent aldehyde dehydrogenase
VTTTIATTERTSSFPEIDRALTDLQAAKDRWARQLPDQLIAIIDECVAGIANVTDEWIAAACRAKGISANEPVAAEEISGGPLATVRFLRLTEPTLRDIQRFSRPRLPGNVTIGLNGQVQVPVMPSGQLFDRLLFGEFSAHVWMQSAITPDNLSDHLAANFRRREPGVALVLGAGNVSGIPATDSLGKLFQDGRVVLLKMNPVNDYLGPIFEQAFRSLVDAGALRIVYGGADVGAYATSHPQVDEVHITGSIQSHEAIVWGPPGPERDRRKAAHDPALKKMITSELGNVTPWIVVPGPYTERELDFQAENVAAMVVNNASFNCIAAKMIVTHRAWPDRQRFLDKVDAVLARVPSRPAYYPGATDRFRRFSGRQANGQGSLPWTLLRDVRPDQNPQLFKEESFACVFAETALDAGDAADFLDRACDLANEQLFGTLGAGLMVHPMFRRDAANEARLQQAIARLRYGTVAINHWPALGYAMMSPPWGGYPGATLEAPASGIGWVHNSFMLDAIEKTVIEGPLVVWPKPLWFPTHRQAHVLARRVLDLYCRPAWWKLPGVFWPALRG